MADRNLSLTPRIEEVREPNIQVTPIHFPLEDIKKRFDESINEILNQFELADSLLKNNNTQGCEKIWRSQIVFSEGLLDFFLHEISKYCMFAMFIGKKKKTEKYNSFMIPLSKVEIAISTLESSEWFFEYLNDRFSREVFLSKESIKDQLNLIGIGFVPVMIKAFPREKEEQSKKDGCLIIEKLFKRRNLIAHQDDRNHATAERNDISEEYVREYIGNIMKIVNAIYDIALEQENITPG